MLTMLQFEMTEGLQYTLAVCPPRTLGDHTDRRQPSKLRRDSVSSAEQCLTSKYTDNCSKVAQ